MFQKALQIWATIVFCYYKQIIVRFIGQMPYTLTWHILILSWISFFPFVTIRVLN